MQLLSKYAVMDPNGGLSFALCLQLAIVMLVFVAVTKEIPTLASQLAGGVGISGLAGGMVGGAFAGAAGGAFAAMGGKAALGGLGRNRNAAATWAAGKIGSGAKSAWDRMNSKGKIKP
jgi:hypothetical protein